jgi:hypothetical protein
MRFVSFDRWTFLIDSGEPFEQTSVRLPIKTRRLALQRSPNFRGRYGCPVA